MLLQVCGNWPCTKMSSSSEDLYPTTGADTGFRKGGGVRITVKY